MKKRGFTLIELLAVIVILALIALITIPVVLNVIEKSKLKTYQRSVEQYGGAVNKAIVEYFLDNEDKTSNDISYNDIKDYIKYEGNKVECTTFEIYKDKTIYLADCKVNGEIINYTYGIYKKEPICKSNSSSKSLELGTKYECKVNNIKKYKFYILSLNNDDTVNLIMDRNICEDGTVNYTSENINCAYNWNTSSSYDVKYGPITAMEKLYNATKDWINIPDMQMNYYNEAGDYVLIDSYYGIFTSDGKTEILDRDKNVTSTIGNPDMPLKARLPKYKEMTDVGCGNDKGTCPVWLVENMKYYLADNDKYSINNNGLYENIRGYWLLSSYPFYKNVRNINYNGSTFVELSGFGSIFGIRPVITISITELS